MSTIETTPQPIVATEDVNKTPASGQANGATTTPAVPAANIEGFDRWIKDFQKYETILVSSSVCCVLCVFILILLKERYDQSYYGCQVQR